MNLEVIRRAPNTLSKWPPVLFVHSGFHAAWCWDEHFLPYFATNGFDAVALSLRGHGNSEGHNDLRGYGLEDYVEDVANVAASLHPRPILIGHSIGAVIVQQYVQSRAASAVVLLCPTPTGPIFIEKMKWFIRFPLATAKMATTGNMIHVLPTLRHLFFSPELPAQQVDAYMNRMQNESPRVFDDISRIQRINPSAASVPTLVAIAKHDAVPALKTQALVHAFNAELEVFNVYHDMMLDPNWQTVASNIANWLNHVPAR